MPEYADPVIDWLDPDKNLITKRFFRQVRNNLLDIFEIIIIRTISSTYISIGFKKVSLCKSFTILLAMGTGQDR